MFYQSSPCFTNLVQSSVHSMLSNLTCTWFEVAGNKNKKNINHKGLQRTANECAEERRMIKTWSAKLTSRHILQAEYCNANRTTWKLTLQDINTTPKELKTERDCSHGQLFCPFWGSSVWRNNQRKLWWIKIIQFLGRGTGYGRVKK